MKAEGVKEIVDVLRASQKGRYCVYSES